jgi:hypothetical protein
MKKIDVSVILPISSSKSKDFESYFTKAILSVKNQSVDINELVIVHSNEESLRNYLSNFDFSGLTVNIVKNEGDFSYANQIKVGVENSKSSWVSFYEFDDEYSSIWFKNVAEYMEAYTDIDGFLPLVVDVDDKGTFAGFTNEATFAASMTSEIGYLTNEMLLAYQNFQSSGMVIRKSTIEEFGSFKPSFKLTFVYELLLRLTYNSAKIMTIPKIGYKHTNMREGSIFWNYKNNTAKMSDDEVKFWIESAKKEYFFIDDRGIKYQPEND